MAVRYYTDYCCDLPVSYAQERDLTIIPMSYKIGDQEFMGIDSQMPIETFYRKMRDGAISSTSQVNTFTFVELWRPVLEHGDDVFYIAFSSGLSGTYQSAVMARKQLQTDFPERKLYIFDSKQASTGEGLMMHYALDKRDQGESPAVILQWLEDHRQNFCAWFTVSDLDFLRRGGRVTAAAAFLGTMLNIKPVLHVNDDGLLIAMEKVKGRARSLRSLVDHMEKTAIEPATQQVFIGHGDCEADARTVADMIHERFGTPMGNFLIAPIGPTIGAHSGPDTIALFFFGKHRN